MEVSQWKEHINQVRENIPQFMVSELEWLQKMDARFLLEEEAKVDKYYLLNSMGCLVWKSNSLFFLENI